eukprot:4195393-Prorocentrum_lima.AAC.1
MVLTATVMKATGGQEAYVDVAIAHKFNLASGTVSGEAWLKEIKELEHILFYQAYRWKVVWRVSAEALVQPEGVD